MNIDTINEVDKAVSRVLKQRKNKIIINQARLGLASKLAQEYIFACTDLVHGTPAKNYIQNMKTETKRHYALLTKIESELSGNEILVEPDEYTCKTCGQIYDEENVKCPACNEVNKNG